MAGLYASQGVDLGGGGSPSIRNDTVCKVTEKQLLSALIMVTFHGALYQICIIIYYY